MADKEYFEPSSDDPSHGAGLASGAAAMMNWLGAFMSVGLVVGMAIWAWQLTVRDVSGIPVIRAIEGPMRIAPENPGGAQADHQGLAVNVIKEGEEAGAVPNSLVLAPPPVDLDGIVLAEAPVQAETPVLAEAAILSAPSSPVALAAPASVSASAQIANADGVTEETLSLIDRLVQSATLLEPFEEGPQVTRPTDDGQVATLQNPAISISVPGVRRSPRPTSRPADLQLASFSSSASTSNAEAVTGGTERTAAPQQIDATTLETGTRLVQLGAFDDPETAQAEWERLTRNFPDYFAGRGRVVQQATSGGREFYRLRAHGFDDLSDARRFCTALLAQGAACIPVTVR
jgi:hypothetical protein